MISSKPTCRPKVPSLNTMTLEIRDSTREFGGGEGGGGGAADIQSVALPRLKFSICF